MIAVRIAYSFALFWSLLPVLYGIFTFVRYFYAYWGSAVFAGHKSTSAFFLASAHNTLLGAPSTIRLRIMPNRSTMAVLLGLEAVFEG